MSFDEWFNQIAGYGLVAEQFYCDLEYYTEKSKEYYPDEKECKHLQRNIVEWLRIAYQEGFKEGKKEAQQG